MRGKLNSTRLALLAGAAITLQGCVAAAIPIAAGGLIGERQISREDASSVAGPEAAPIVNPVVEVASNAATQEPMDADLAPAPSNDPAPSARAPALPETPEDQGRFGRAPDLAGPNLPPAQPITSATPPPTVAIVRSSPAPSESPSAVTQLPDPTQSDLAASTAGTSSPALSPSAPQANTPPAELASSASSLPAPIPSAREPLEEAAAAIPPTQPPASISGQSRNALTGINQLLSYANSRQISADETPESAMLLDRIALTPERAECNGIAPTVLIDLDPEGGLFDSKTASRPPSGLARGLNQLRLNGISVAWISANTIDQIDAITRALRYSGLDLNNEDRVLLLRGEDDRKQTLREELSQISCLIAIAGDTRSDFDELYDYLKNPADAQSLEPLIGDGWFLIPQPLISAGSEQ